MLPNAYLLANIGFDTDENEPPMFIPGGPPPNARFWMPAPAATFDRVALLGDTDEPRLSAGVLVGRSISKISKIGNIRFSQNFANFCKN